MSVIAEFTLHAPTIALTPTLEAVPGMTVELDQQMVAQGYTPLVIVWASGGDFEAFDTALETDTTIASHAIIEDLDGRKLYRLELSRKDLQEVYPAYQNVGAVPMSGHGKAGVWRRRIRFPNRDALVDFQQFCTEKTIDFSLKRLYTPGDDETAFQLTEPQLEALVAAYEVGYFNVPRDATLKELSSELGISKQSVSERLRRAQSRFVSNAILGK
ncbi:helix-turn-helix domain-containing protein [Haladaptatus pallidirubidus]|uniref:Helix-turn-helix domain-containing protein n=1 Tax=Haladaptatus pallidirubidus TaxID=1008152 RepID=A0AAV3UFW5_9EURY|nr:helix-turn-helix domain-containing protein [Haladaptatus pallidirubidus]